MADEKPISEAFILRNKYGTIIGVFVDEEALKANMTYGDDFHERCGKSIEPADYTIQPISLFKDKKRNSAIRQLIHSARNERTFTPKFY